MKTPTQIAREAGKTDSEVMRTCTHHNDADRLRKIEAQLENILSIACKGTDAKQFSSVAEMQVAMLYRNWQADADRLAKVEQENAALREDKADVDWLEKGGKISSWEAENDQGEKTGVRCFELPDREADECFSSARAAIRAARKTEDK